MIIAVFTSLLFLCATVGLQMKLRRVRKLRVQQMELTPNCLLTRYPIVFVAGPRSLFRLFEPWNEIPIFLREHGYEVFVFEPNYDRRSIRINSVAQQIKLCLHALALRSPASPILNKYHVIGESSCESEMQALASQINPDLASITLAIADATSNSKVAVPVRPHSLKPLAIAIEELHLSEALISPSALHSSLAGAPNKFPLDMGQTTNSQLRVWNYVALRLLSLHNWIAQLRKQAHAPVHPLTVGLTLSRDWQVELRFLRRAVELAEQDAQFSGN